MADFLDNRARLGSVVPRARFDNLRHSHATHLVLAGVHPKLAQEPFWHSTVTTTLDLYSRGTAAMQEDVPAVSTPRFRML
jgi:site-specific recombinase XerD